MKRKILMLFCAFTLVGASACSHFPFGGDDEGGDDDSGGTPDAGMPDPDGGGACTGSCPACDEDADCPDDQHCDGGTCVPTDDPPSCDPACEAGEECVDGQCVPDDDPPPPECDDDGDCDEGEVCDGGTCVCDGGDDDDDGTDGACKPGKTLLCHEPPGHPSPPHEICVGSAAVAAHLAHGDVAGVCP